MSTDTPDTRTSTDTPGFGKGRKFQSINLSKHISIAPYVASDIWRLKVLNSSAERQLYDSEFQTALADNESVIRGTESNSLSADRSVLSGW